MDLKNRSGIRKAAAFLSFSRRISGSDFSPKAGGRSRPHRESRPCLRKALPETEECISWSMPTYRKGRNIIHFAAAKKHIGIYPGGEATTVFAEELAGMDVSKGTIRLPHDQEIPASLIDKIARWCYKEYSK